MLLYMVDECVSTHRRMTMTPGFTLGFFAPLQLQEEPKLSGAGDMERGIAVWLGALHTSATFLLAEITVEPPPASGDSLDAVDRLHVDRVADANLGNKQSTEQVSPGGARGGLLKGAALVRTETAGDRLVGRDGAFAAEPLVGRDVGHTVAVLVDGQIAAIAENNGIRLLCFSVIANGTDTVRGFMWSLRYARGLSIPETLQISKCDP